MQKIANEIMFGSIALSPNQVFVLRKNVFATVNLKPYSRGHVLVVARRSAAKLQDLTEIELLDLFTTAQEVAKRIESIYGRECHLTIQNGADAGQTVQQAHVHIVPGKGGVESEMSARTPEDMAEEAEQYRPYFEQGIQ